MNIFFKAYCRLYQLLLKLSIPFLPYRTPKILNSYNDISLIIKKNKLNNILYFYMYMLYYLVLI